MAGSCGIPATARTVVLNATVTQPTAAGYLSLYPSGAAPRVNSTINFPTAGLTRSNNALIGLSDTGALAIQAGTPGTVHLVLDVYGYYAE